MRQKHPGTKLFRPQNMEVSGSLSKLMWWKLSSYDTTVHLFTYWSFPPYHSLLLCAHDPEVTNRTPKQNKESPDEDKQPLPLRGARQPKLSPKESVELKSKVDTAMANLGKDSKAASKAAKAIKNTIALDKVPNNAHKKPRKNSGKKQKDEKDETDAEDCDIPPSQPDVPKRRPRASSAKASPKAKASAKSKGKGKLATKASKKKAVPKAMGFFSVSPHHL